MFIILTPEEHAIALSTYVPLSWLPNCTIMIVQS